MMGIPVEGPTYIYGGNQSVLANTTIPDSTLKKKSQVLHVILFEKELLEMNGGCPMSTLMTMKQIC